MVRFTTNWYLYKSHFHNISAQSQNSESKSDFHRSKEENNIPIRKLKVKLRQ